MPAYKEPSPNGAYYDGSLWEKAPVVSSIQVTRNFLSLFLSNVVGQFLTLWAFVKIASTFGPEGFGKFSFAQVVALYFIYFADFGLQTLGTRVIAQRKGEISRSVWNITVLRTLLAVACFVLLLILSFLIAPLREIQPLIIIFGLALLPSAMLFEWVFQGLEQMEYVALARVTKGMVFGILVFFFVHSDSPLTYSALFYVTGFVVAAGLLIGVYVRKFGLIRGTIEPAALKDTLVAGAPLAAGSFFTQINYNFGTIALGLFLTHEDVGLFSAAYKIVLFLLAFGAVAAANAVFPLMAKSYKKSITLFSSSLRNSLRVFVFAAIPLGIGGSILASQIMGFLYSPEYQRAVIVFQLSVWMVVIVIYRMIFENVLVATSRNRDYFVGYLLAGVLTVLGNLILVPVLGIAAPAIVGILAESTLLLYFLTSCKFLRLSYIANITLKPLLAGSVMGLALLFIPWNLFVLIVVGIVIYFVSLVVLRAITFEEVAAYVHSLVR